MTSYEAQAHEIKAKTLNYKAEASLLKKDKAEALGPKLSIRTQV